MLPLMVEGKIIIIRSKIYFSPCFASVSYTVKICLKSHQSYTVTRAATDQKTHGSDRFADQSHGSDHFSDQQKKKRRDK